MKLEIEDFIYEVKEELLCYEEIGEAGAEKWAEDFRKWLANDSIKKKNVVNGKYFKIDDESEIFDIADEYLAALENNSIGEYWKKFQ